MTMLSGNTHLIQPPSSRSQLLHRKLDAVMPNLILCFWEKPEIWIFGQNIQIFQYQQLIKLKQCTGQAKPISVPGFASRLPLCALWRTEILSFLDKIIPSTVINITETKCRLMTIWGTSEMRQQCKRCVENQSKQGDANIISQLLSEFICNLDANGLTYSTTHASFLGIENTRSFSFSPFSPGAQPKTGRWSEVQSYWNSFSRTVLADSRNEKSTSPSAGTNPISHHCYQRLSWIICVPIYFLCLSSLDTLEK